MLIQNGWDAFVDGYAGAHEVAEPGNAPESRSRAFWKWTISRRDRVIADVIRLGQLQFKIKHLLICTTATALVFLRPIGPIMLTAAIVFYVLVLAISDLIALFHKTRAHWPKSDDEYYRQFEPKPELAITLAMVAFLLYLIGWLTGAYAEPGKRPIPAILIADIVFTVVGFTCCVYARLKSHSYLQTGLTWIPLCCWFLHSIILLGHGWHLERV